MLKFMAYNLCLVFVLTMMNFTIAQALDPNKVVQPKMTPALSLGKLNYEAKCAKCHGKNAAGTDKGPTFLHRVYHPGHHGDGAFYKAAKRGSRAHHWPFGDMAPVKGVTDAQIKTIIQYVRGLQKANGLF
jgi:mono/diheme cytochrome c family protein